METTKSENSEILCVIELDSDNIDCCNELVQCSKVSFE